jgi:TonB-linked SusC/RagA family outer membrane protein
MKCWQKIILLSAIFMVNFSVVFAQTKIISGKVTDKDGLSLPGVNVLIEGTTTGTVTNNQGEFSIHAEAGQKIVFRFIGMETTVLEIKNNTSNLKVTLSDGATMLSEAVVVGYGVQRRESIVGSIGVTKADDIKVQGNVSNMTDALTGLIPGVSVLSVSGMPGGDMSSNQKIYTPSEILIRGKTTWNNAAPLILVDGIERSMNEIDISEVESVSVLKDASATAVFGVKGGNGVILITTKRGEVGKAKFNFEYENSLESASKRIETASIPEAAIARNIALERMRRLDQSIFNDFYLSDQEVEFHRTGQYPYAYQSLDWNDIMLKDDFAKSHRVNATIRGGSSRVKYFASGSYSYVGDLMNSQDLGQGYVPEYSYQRMNVRSNLDFKVTNTTNLTANFSAVHGLRNGPSEQAQEGIFSGITHWGGNAPILRYEDGVYGMFDGRNSQENPFFQFNYSGARSYPSSIVNMDYTLNQKLDFLTKGLNVGGKLAYDNTFRNDGREIRDRGYTRKSIDKEFYLSGGYYDYDTKTYMLNGAPADMSLWTLYAEPVASNHGFGWAELPLGYSPEEVKLGNAERTLYYELKMDYVRSFDFHNVGAMTMFSRREHEKGSDWPGKREDWVGRITYDYAGRYLLEMNAAYNGSEKFGPDYRFDFFPSLAAGWMITEERFIKENLTWLERFKIRYSYGLVGNDGVKTGGTWPYMTTWETYTRNMQNLRLEDNYYGYPRNYTEYPRYVEGAPGNPFLRWEKSTKQNLGFDVGVFRNKLALTVDLFNEHRTDMLLGSDVRKNTVPPLFGKDVPPANVGESKSRGAEVELTYRTRVNKAFDYWVSTFWSESRSTVVYKESTLMTPLYQRAEGKPVDQTLSGIGVGFIESWDDLYSITGAASDAGNQQLLPGDMFMLDFNSDGKFNSTDDNVPYGYPTYPQNNYSLAGGVNYKGLGITVRFVGAYNATRQINDQIFLNNNLYVPKFILDQTWSPEYNNVNPTYPALSPSAKSYFPRGQFRLYDGSFFRLQSAQISYSLPERWIAPLQINNLKLYVNGRNLFLWTRMPNDGVGLKGDDKNYPTRTQINMGVNIQF